MTGDADRPLHPSYLDFEVVVGAGVRRAYPVRIESPAGELDITMRFPFARQALENRLLALENALLRSGGTRRLVASPEQREVQAFGQALFEAILPEEARGLYYQSRREAELQGKGLRLKLRFAPPELASLPWEFLYDARQGDYVGLSTATPVVRDLGLPQPIEPLRIAPPLRILGMVASPVNLAALDVAHERQRVESALRGLGDRGSVELRWLEGQTWRDLQHEIRRDEFHVLHFVGHGGFDAAADEGLVALTGDDGSAHHVSATNLAMLLADEPSLRLVVLNSCDGARGGSRDVFASTASILVRRGIPAVLAMQYEITDQAAIEFARSFYEAVADGAPVDAAVAEARKAVRLAIPGSLEWATPVLHQCAPDGVLFDLQRPAATPASAPPSQAPGLGGADGRPEPSVAAASAVTPGTIPKASASARFRSAWAALPTLGKGIAALLTGAVALLAVLAALGLFDDSGSTAPQSQLSGTLSDVAITDRDLALGDFCERRRISCADLDSAARRRPGHVVGYTVEAVGYEGKQLPIRWSMYDAATRRQVTEPTLIQQNAWPDGYYVPAAARDRNSGELWFPLPPVPGRYFLRLELYPPDGARLDTADTEPFDAP